MVRRSPGTRRMQAPGRGRDLSPFRADDVRRPVHLAPRALEAATGMRSGLHLTIDRIKCDGHGLCAELLPELIRLDDWGYPIIAPGPVPQRLVPLAERAVSTCPVLALALGRTALPR